MTVVSDHAGTEDTRPDLITDVIKFHHHAGIEMPVKPVFDSSVVDFRIKFIREELHELIEAADNKDLEKTADALADIIYVALGGALCLGIPFGRVWDEVQRSNMDKRRASADESWKHVVKPPGWVGPQIAAILEDASK